MRWTDGVLVLFLCGLAEVASAQVPEPQPLPSELPALKLLQQLDSQATLAARLSSFDHALTLLVQPTPLRGAVLCGRADILEKLNREREALEGFEQCSQLRPSDPQVLLGLGFIEVSQRKVAQGAQHVIRAIELDPDVAHNVDPEQLHGLQRQLAYSGAVQLSDRLTDALAGAGWGRENPAAFSAVAEKAIQHQLKAGDKTSAAQLLPSITAPGTGVDMLIDRRFSTLWPEIERWAGDDLSIQRRALLDGATETYKTAHTPTSRLAYVNALNTTGRTDDAVEELRRWSTEKSGDPDQYYHFTSVVILGRLLGEQGRRSEGIVQLRAALDSADPSDKSAINVVPNLAYHLLLAKDYRGAAEILDRFTPKEEGVEAPAALGYFVALRACSLQGLGKNEAAQEAYNRVRTVYRANRAAVEIATSCVGTQDEQAALWIANVVDEDSRTDMLVALEEARYRAAQRLPVKGLREIALRMIMDRTDVRAAFGRYGRALPDRYRPALANFVGAPPAPIRHVADGPTT